MASESKCIQQTRSMPSAVIFLLEQLLRHATILFPELSRRIVERIKATMTITLNLLRCKNPLTQQMQKWIAHTKNCCEMAEIATADLYSDLHQKRGQPTELGKKEHKKVKSASMFFLQIGWQFAGHQTSLYLEFY